MTLHTVKSHVLKLCLPQWCVGFYSGRALLKPFQFRNASPPVVQHSLELTKGGWAWTQVLRFHGLRSGNSVRVLYIP